MPILIGVRSRTRTYTYKRVWGRARPANVRARLLWWGTESYEGNRGGKNGNRASVLLNRRSQLRPTNRPRPQNKKPTVRRRRRERRRSGRWLYGASSLGDGGEVWSGQITTAVRPDAGGGSDEGAGAAAWGRVCAERAEGGAGAEGARGWPCGGRR